MAQSVRQIQLIELDILRQVLTICEESRVVYYALGGTLLGAVRHQGMIPWDDDIDIGMPRPEYERFLKIAAKKLKAPYQLHTLQQRNGEYSYYFARVENTEVKMLRKAGLQDAVIPAWIDVFPLDGVPKDKVKREIWLRKCDLLLKLYKGSQYSYFGASRDLNVKRSLPKTVLRETFILFRMERWVDAERAWNRLDRALKENEYDSCDTLINFCGNWGLKEMFPKSIYGKGKLYPFEDLMLNGPEDADFVLRQMYGDYMELPPEDQRNHHHIELIENDTSE